MARVWSEIVFSGDAARAVLSRAVARGTLRRLAQGIYTSAVDDDPAAVVRRNLFRIVGHELPDAVIVDRSARVVGTAARPGWSARWTVCWSSTTPVPAHSFCPASPSLPARGPDMSTVTWSSLRASGSPPYPASCSTT